MERKQKHTMLDDARLPEDEEESLDDFSSDSEYEPSEADSGK